MGFFSFFKKKDTVEQTEEKEKQGIENSSIQEQKSEDKSTEIKDISDLVDSSDSHDDILKKVAEALDLDLDVTKDLTKEDQKDESIKEDQKDESIKEDQKDESTKEDQKDESTKEDQKDESTKEDQKEESIKEDQKDKITSNIDEDKTTSVSLDNKEETVEVKTEDVKEDTYDNFIQKDLEKDGKLESNLIEKDSSNAEKKEILENKKSQLLDNEKIDNISNLEDRSLESNKVLDDNLSSCAISFEEKNTQDNLNKTLDEISSNENISSNEDLQDVDAIAKEDEAASKDEVEKETKLSFFAKLKKTRENLAYGVSSLIKGRKIDEDLYEELETALLTADLGVETCEYVIEKLRTESKLRALHDADLLKENLHNILVDLLKPCEIPLNIEEHKPFVILMVGVNGAGKTTTIGKLAQKYKAQGKKVMLAAGDTFRAAAVEQLKEWGKRIDVPVIAQGTGADSASVLYDALESAKSKNADVLICDTAGRLQNKDNLMDELRKIVRVLKKKDETVPHEVLLVLDAATGQNAVSQTKLFKEAVDVTGIALTKLDGTAKGGVIFALADKYKLPIRYVGIGERAEDLHEFKVDPFVHALIEDKNN